MVSKSEYTSSAMNANPVDNTIFLRPLDTRLWLPLPFLLLP